MLVTLLIPSSRQVDYILENFQIIWNFTTYREKIQNDSKYKIVKNLFMDLKNSNPNGCYVVINNLHLVFLLFSKNNEN